MHDFRAEGQRLLEFQRRHPRSSFRDCDVVFCHPRTGAVVFVGSYVAAKDAAFLQEYQIRHIVNCQEPSSENYFEGETGFEYFRFDVANWKRQPDVETSEGARRYVSAVLSFLDAALDDGNNVLVHCYAGAHRAGTTAVAYLMHAHGISFASALKRAQKRRPVINPIGRLNELLTLLELRFA
ncbi:DSPTP1, partial [Symbiodinium microadriaticum]